MSSTKKTRSNKINTTQCKDLEGNILYSIWSVKNSQHETSKY